MNGLGGSLETLYCAFGSDDIVAIVNLPDHATTAAASLTVGAIGTVNVRITVLITSEEIDEAAKKVVDYRPPGQ